MVRTEGFTSNNAYPHYKHDVEVQDFALCHESVARSGWSSKRQCETFIASGFQPIEDAKGQRTKFVLTKTGAIEAVKVRSEDQSHVLSVLRGLGTTQQASTALKTMGINFSYPKPIGLVKHLISMVRGDDFIVLDSFAGSGTTAQAVRELNRQDKGTRRFILVEMDADIAFDVTSKRVRNSFDGDSGVNSTGGGFRFCKLSEPLFNAQGQINESVSFSDLAHHIFFTETGEPLSQRPDAKEPLIGTMNGIAYYLLWRGAGTETLLDSAALRNLLPYDGVRVVYADGCRVSAGRLKAAGVTFKQVPYEVRTS